MNERITACHRDAGAGDLERRDHAAVVSKTIRTALGLLTLNQRENVVRAFGLEGEAVTQMELSIERGVTRATVSADVRFAFVKLSRVEPLCELNFA